MKYSLIKFRNKLGKSFIPISLTIFSICLFIIVGGSVYQKKVEIQEGRLAEKTIRANKTVEDTAETKAKKKLAAEAVTPEYTYQEDTAKIQHKRIEKMFKLVNVAKEKVNKEYQDKKAKAKKDEVIPQPTLDEKMASLKSQFEPLDQEEVTFFQAFPNSFYQNLFSLSDSDLKIVESESLKLVDEKMSGRIRDTELENVRQSGLEKLPFLEVSSSMQQAIRYIVNLGIVTNEFANEKKTEELKQKAMEDVQPVMIYQGEIIVREGTKVDENAMKKLKILGLTNQNPSVFPLITLFLTIVLQVLTMVYFAKQVAEEGKRRYFILFYTSFMLISVLLMKFFQMFQTEQLMFVPLFFPAAFTPLVLSYFVNRRSASLAVAFQVIFAMFVFYGSIGTNFLTICLVSYLFSGVMATVVSRTRISEQGASAMLWLIVFPVILSFILMVYQGMSIFDGKTITAMICAIAGSVFAFIATIGLQPYIELLVTDDSMIVLNELSNPNHPLLKQLLEEAPGTYHHSMMVASLSANAVAEIGGRSLLTRVACYYHDIGKVKHANFFVENLPAGAENPHNFLLPEDSKQIIFGHVIDGAKILEEYKMPQMIIDVCKQHHGTTLMKYFYYKEKERNPDISEESFRYPGPKPQTREAGIVNIADTCEAAVRAMDQPTNEKIKEFVHSVIQDRISDGQLDECGLTMKEIRIVEKSLVSGLCSTFHSRIKYPKMETEAKRMKEEQEKSEI